MPPPLLIRLRGRHAGRFASAAVVCLLWVGASALQLLIFGAWKPVHAYTDLRAGLRLFAVLALGWPAAVGLWSGSLLCSALGWGPRLSAAAALLRALLSGLAPVAAWRVSAAPLRLQADLRGLRLSHLLALTLVSALFWDVPDAVLLQHYDAVRIAPSLLGLRLLVNVAATLALLYFGSFAGRLYLRRLARRAVRDGC